MLKILFTFLALSASLLVRGGISASGDLQTNTENKPQRSHTIASVRRSTETLHE